MQSLKESSCVCSENSCRPVSYSLLPYSLIQSEYSGGDCLAFIGGTRTQYQWKLSRRKLERVVDLRRQLFGTWKKRPSGTSATPVSSCLDSSRPSRCSFAASVGYPICVRRSFFFSLQLSFFVVTINGALSRRQDRATVRVENEEAKPAFFSIFPALFAGVALGEIIIKMVAAHFSSLMTTKVHERGEKNTEFDSFVSESDCCDHELLKSAAFPTPPPIPSSSLEASSSLPLQHLVLEPPFFPLTGRLGTENGLWSVGCRGGSRARPGGRPETRAPTGPRFQEDADCVEKKRKNLGVQVAIISSASTLLFCLRPILCRPLNRRASDSPAVNWIIVS